MKADNRWQETGSATLTDKNISISSGPAIRGRNICRFSRRYSGTSVPLLPVLWCFGQREAQRRPDIDGTFHGHQHQLLTVDHPAAVRTSPTSGGTFPTLDRSQRRARETPFHRKMKTARLGRVWRGELYLQHTNPGWEPAAELSVCRLHLSKAWVEFVFCFSLRRSAARAPSHYT